MMKPKAVELKTHIRSQIRNYEELPQLITSLQASHAQVFRSMDVIVRAHAIPSIGALTEAKAKNQVQMELDMYFEQLMRIAPSADLQMSADTMHQYVVGPDALKTMKRMLYDKLDKGAKSLYPNATEARVRFHKNVTTEYANTITNYQAWHQFATTIHQEDVDELVFPQLSET